MRDRQLAAVLLVVALVSSALVFSSGLAVAKARGEPGLSVFVPENDVTPGEETELSLFIQNSGEVAYATSPTERARVTTARNVQVTVEAGDAPVEVNTGTMPIGNVPEGVSSAIPVSISVDENAEPGEYTLPVTVEYEYTEVIGSGDGAYSDETETLHTSVTLVVSDDARFEIVSVSADDFYGSSGPVTLALSNVGSATARDANVSIASGSSQFTFGGTQSATIFAGDWAPGETREFTVEGQLAEGANRRTYPLSVVVSYESADGDSRSSDALASGVTLRVESRFSIADVESSLSVGGEGTVSGTIVNDGGSVARNAVLVLSANARNVEPIETEYSLGDLAAGESAAFSFDVEVSESAAGGPRQLSFTVRYRDGNGEVVESDPLPARVDVVPKRDVFDVTPVNATLEAGGSGTLSLRVTNRGEETLTDVSAKLFANDPLGSTDDEAFIDRLAPGESETIVFAVSASNSALEKTYPVSVDFQYDDADGDTLLSDTYQVPVTVSTPAGGGPPVVGGVVALVVVAGVGFYTYRRRTSR